MPENPIDELNALAEQAHTELTACADEVVLRAWNTKYFGDKGLVKAALGKIGAAEGAAGVTRASTSGRPSQACSRYHSK